MLGPWKFQNAPFKLSRSPAEVRKPPPMIGENNREIMEDQGRRLQRLVRHSLSLR